LEEEKANRLIEKLGDAKIIGRVESFDKHLIKVS
jgi:hypothetical protein